MTGLRLHIFIRPPEKHRHFSPAIKVYMEGQFLSCLVRVSSGDLVDGEIEHLIREGQNQNGGALLLHGTLKGVRNASTLAIYKHATPAGVTSSR